MDGLIGPNAPTPKPPTPASGISEILFDIGGILAADPRNPRADLALIFYQLAASLQARARLRLADDRAVSTSSSS